MVNNDDCHAMFNMLIINLCFEMSKIYIKKKTDTKLMSKYKKKLALMKKIGFLHNKWEKFHKNHAIFIY